LKHLYRFLALAWAAIIFYLSSQPGSQVGIPPPWDKLAHFGAYALLSLLLVKGGFSAPTAVILASLYGAGDEWHQSFVPGRDASIGDVLADAAGALFAAIGSAR